MAKNIVHLLTHDKFTAGYINFMNLYMKEYKHTFLVSSSSSSQDENIKGKLISEENVIYYTNGKQLAFGRSIRKLIKKADKIVVSGIFGLEQMICFWPRKVFKKIYLHYWGGDFYQLREKLLFMKWRENIARFPLKYCFKKSFGAIFLIDGEYEKYQEITGITKENVYVAGMPIDPEKEFPYYKYRNAASDGTLRIVVGNSASWENHHKEIFEKLSKFKNDDIELYCPLSYGIDEYRNEICKIGFQIFGKKFHPIMKWMNLYDYYSFLATCHIGIFNNDRQQAMGNIFTMFFLGKKLYLRSDTSMAMSYKKKGFVFFDVNSLDTCTFDELKHFPERNHNIKVADSWKYMENSRNEWKRVFDA